MVVLTFAIVIVCLHSLLCSRTSYVQAQCLFMVRFVPMVYHYVTDYRLACILQGFLCSYKSKGEKERPLRFE